MVAKETRDSIIDTIDHRLGDPTTETIVAQVTDHRGSHIQADDEKN